MSKLVLFDMAATLRKKVEKVTKTTNDVSILGTFSDLEAGLMMISKSSAYWYVCDDGMVNYLSETPVQKVRTMFRAITVLICLSVAKRIHVETERSIFKEMHKNEISADLAHFSDCLRHLGVHVTVVTPITGRTSHGETVAIGNPVRRDVIVTKVPRAISRPKERLFKHQIIPLENEKRDSGHSYSIEQITDFVLSRETLSAELIKKIEADADHNAILAEQIEDIKSRAFFLRGRTTTLSDV